MKTILVADDDRGMARTVCDILRRHGWSATEVHSGEAAVAAATAQRFAVVLMDVRMPGLNGVEAFRIIREAQPQTPVILMTAYAAPDLLSQAEREGVLQILPKPLPWNTLSGLLDKISALEGSVLVVDDDPSFLETLEAVLAAAGRLVRRATSIDEAVHLLAQRPQRVVVLDLALDGLQPRDSVLAIRRVNPAVVLILCSGHTRLMDETLSSLPPGWVFAGLIKPFPPRRLLDLLDSVNGPD
jgi:DNA-binding NtrC family response regulator